MKTRNVLMVGGANIPAVCLAATRRGYNIIAVSFPESIGKSVPNPATIHTEAVDFRHVMPTVRRLIQLHEELGFDGVVAVSEYGLLAAAMVARQLGLPGTPLAVVQNTRDKVRMRRTLEAQGLGQVRFRACANLDEAHEFFAGVGGSIIVKPLMGTGSDGVSRVDHADGLAAAWRLAGGARSFGGVICEEYIEGPEVSIEAYVVDGRFVPVAITDKLTDARFLEMGQSQPTILTDAMQARVFAATGEVLRGLGITNAVTHTEMRISPRGPLLIETHTRMGGDSIHVLTHETTGVDLADLHVAFALGEKPTVEPHASGKGAAIRFIGGGEGRIASIDQPLPDASAGIHEVRSYVSVGVVATGRSASLDRFGHVIAVAANRAEADRIADQTAAEFHYGLEDLQLAAAVA